MNLPSVVQQSGGQRAQTAAVSSRGGGGDTKRLVTDLPGCMTTLHWPDCVWESWLDGVFLLPMENNSGILAQSCPHDMTCRDF